MLPRKVQHEGLKSAYEDADKHNWTKAELDAYDYNWMRQQNDKGKISKAEKNGDRDVTGKC